MSSSISPQIFSYIIYSELFPSRKADIKYIKEQFSRFDLKNTILFLSRLSLFLSIEKNAKDTQIQVGLCKQYFNDYTLEKVKGVFTDIRLVFHRHQILYLLKKAFQVSGDFPEISFEILAQRHKLATSCLVTNEFLSLMSFDEEEYKKKTDDEKRIYLWKEFLPGYELNNPSELKFDIARLRYFFNTILPQISEKDKSVDIKSLLQEISGFSIEEYMDLIFAVLALYITGRKTILTKPNNVFIKVSNFTHKTNISEEKILEFLRLISKPLEEYKELILDSSDLDLNYGFLVFRKYPIALFDEERFICLDFHFLLDKISKGIFWLINDGLPSKQDRDGFHTLWGKIFERYINMFFNNIFSGVENKYFASPKFDSTDEEISDAIIIDNEDIFFLEFKFTVLSIKAKYVDTVDSLVEEILKKFEKNEEGEWKGYGQIANKINKLFSKTSNYNFDAIEKTKMKRIFPVLIVYEPILNAPFTNYFFNLKFHSLINQEALIDNVEVMPLTVLPVEEFEASFPFFSNTSAFFQDWINFNNNQEKSFSDFLSEMYRRNPTVSSPLIDNEYERYVDEVKARFFPNSGKK